MDRCAYLIIGNSAAAMGGVAGIRESDPRTAIHIVTREPHHTYSRPLISYLLGGKVDESKMLYRPCDFYEESDVVAWLGVEVRSVNPELRRVETSEGYSLAFDKLLIATGGRPIMPRDVEGTEARGVFTLATWDDAREIRQFIEKFPVEKALVVGGGLIGLKSVEALVGLGIGTTVVELTDRILSATFDRTASDLARSALAARGVEVMCGTTVSRVEQKDGRVAGAVLRDGTGLSFDMVIFAIGVTPNKGLVEGTSVETDRGILVDDRMETSVEGIYAAGDVTQAAELLSGEKRTIAIFPNAYRQGYVAGSNMAGRARRYGGSLAMNAVDVCGLPTISVGATDPVGEGYEVLSELDDEGPVYKKIVLRDDRIVGAIFVGDIDRAGIITGLIKEKVNVSGFKELLLTDEFGLISLPSEYRKHVVSGAGIEV